MIRLLVRKFLNFKVVWDIKRDKRPLDVVWCEYIERIRRLDSKRENTKS